VRDVVKNQLEVKGTAFFGVDEVVWKQQVYSSAPLVAFRANHDQDGSKFEDWWNFKPGRGHICSLAMHAHAHRNARTHARMQTRMTAHAHACTTHVYTRTRS